MKNERFIEDMKKVLLTDAPNKLRSARKVVRNVPYELHDFADYLANIAEPTLNPADLMKLLICGLADINSSSYRFQKKDSFKQELWIENRRITEYISFFPLIIDRISSKEFAKCFRELFEYMMSCEAEPPVEEDKVEYGVIIVRKGLVNISNKDKAEVLASLYNNSHPQGLGFLEYDRTPMTIEKAREILKTNNEFNYLYGRVMKISLKNNLVITEGYNEPNGFGAAERAISQCKNIEL